MPLPLHKRQTIVKKPPLVCQWTLGEVLEPKKKRDEKLKAGPPHTPPCAKSEPKDKL